MKKNQSPSSFYISYFAKKHGARITRKGRYDKPDGTQGQIRTSKDGSPCLTYWDLDADGWRNATGKVQIKI